ncbi:hypothetical protein LLG34_08665 [bacterium]|nr:hypothetical protein [bacterium]
MALSQKGIVSEVVGAGLESALTTFPLLSRGGKGAFATHFAQMGYEHTFIPT